MLRDSFWTFSNPACVPQRTAYKSRRCDVRRYGEKMSYDLRDLFGQVTTKQIGNVQKRGKRAFWAALG